MTKSQIKFYKGFFTPYFEIANLEFNKFSTEITKKGEPLFESIIKAAFTKCFEFNYFNSRPKDFKNSFFLLATLRGICEDLISLSYLKTLDEKKRNSLIHFNYNFDFTKNLIVQDDFFKKYNPGQINISPNLFAHNSYCDFVKNKPTNKNDAKKNGYLVYPSVFEMAKQSGYVDVYNFLYYSTSALVHFRPDTLLKLGWNKTQKDIKSETYHYSIQNYCHYYTAFCLMYGSFLFCEFVTNFQKETNISNYLVSETKYFRKSFKLFDWPEIMTHEHLNLESPSEFDKMIKRGKHL